MVVEGVIVIIVIVVCTSILTDYSQELALCQGWPKDVDFSHLSDSQLGKAVGNSWPVPVAAKLVAALATTMGWA